MDIEIDIATAVDSGFDLYTDFDVDTGIDVEVAIEIVGVFFAAADYASHRFGVGERPAGVVRRAVAAGAVSTAGRRG